MELGVKRKRQTSEPRRYQPGDVLETHAGVKVTLIEIISPGRWRAKFVCPDCPPDKGVRMVKIYTGASAFENFSGLCPPHSQIRRRKLTGRQPHRSGAIVLWDERPVGSYDVPFICRERDIGEHKDSINFFQLQRQRLNPQRFGEWSGACKACRRRLRGKAFTVNGVVIRRDTNRATEGYGWVLCPDGISPDCEKERYVKIDIGSYLSGRHTGRCKACSNVRRAGSLPKEKLPLTHAPILERVGDMIKVQCLYPVSENEHRICGVASEINVKVLRHTWEYATGFCSDHHIARTRGRLEAYKQAIRALLARYQNDNGQKNDGAEKRGRGRTPKSDETKKAEVADKLRLIKEAVLAMKSAGRQRSEVTANAVAAVLNIGGVTGGDTMMRQVNKCDDNFTWPTLRDAIWDDSKINL
jgi:hypothetical protein